MRFAAPEFLWLLLLVPALGLVSWWVAASRRSALRRFAGGAPFVDRFTGEVSPHRRVSKLLLLCAALASLPVALARPQWGTRLEPVTRQGSDIVVVLDTSLSMAVEDLAPNRLEQAKHAIGSLLERLAGDRVALVTFAGQATLTCPLTVDHAAIRLFLESLDVESVGAPGTALGRSLEVALAALNADGRETGDRGRSIVLFSDGEDHEGGLDDALREVTRAGVPVYAIGTGTATGAPIPVKDPAGILTGYKKDREGKAVTSRLDETVLEQIALDTEGRYYRATAGEMEIEELADVLGFAAEDEIGSELRTRYEDRFQLPLLFALLALFAETLLGDRRARGALGRREAS